MSFKDLVPSQVDAVNYLNNIATKYKQNIRVADILKVETLQYMLQLFATKKLMIE